jgi:hypothetical protein
MHVMSHIVAYSLFDVALVTATQGTPDMSPKHRVKVRSILACSQ